MRNLFLMLITVAGISACTTQGNSSRSKSGGKTDAGGDSQAVTSDATGEAEKKPEDVVDTSSAEQKSIDWDEVPKISKPPVDNRSHTQILCQDGLKIANSPKKDDFTNIFNVICKGDDVSDDFNQSIAAAYNGVGEPSVKLLSASTNELYLTKLLFIYTIEAPIDSPVDFSKLKIFESLQDEGVADSTSRLSMKVESRKAFPGKASVEEVILEQRIELAAGAALYDVRRTELNNYLLAEHTRDINMTTEHLLDADTNQHYHVARGILIGIKGASAGMTNLVYVTELEVKNRIDPVRLQKTVLDLAKVIQKKIYARTNSQENPAE